MAGPFFVYLTTEYTEAKLKVFSAISASSAVKDCFKKGFDKSYKRLATFNRFRPINQL